MRARPVAIAASIAVHAGLAGLLVAWRSRAEPVQAAAADLTTPAPAALPALPAVVDDSVDVAFATVTEAQYQQLTGAWSPPSAPAATPAAIGRATPAATAAAPTTATAGPGDTAITTGSGVGLGGTGIVGPGGGDPGGATPGPRPGHVDLRVRRDSALAVGTPVVDPEGTLEPHDLRPVGGGYLESDEGVFVARVAPDGTVTFHDRPNVQVRLKLPTPSHIVRGLADWAHDPYARIREGDCDPNDPTPAEVCKAATAALDARPKISDVVTVIGIAGSFDITDAVMRAAGQDPYGARKQAMLDRTRAVRERMALAEQRKGLAGSAAAMRKALARVRGLPDDTRRDRLFALWDSCLEGGTDAERDAGRLARGEVVAWIRAHAPAGSAAGFTAAQLAAYNARRASTATFAPYE